MQQNLRTAAVRLHTDLGNDHFEGDRKLGDPSLLVASTKIQAGFFVVRQGSVASLAGPGYVNEGLDQNNVPSFRAVDHFLYFTVKLKGNRQENFFSTMLQPPAATVTKFFNLKTAYNVTSGTLSTETLSLGNPYYSSQWAEVCYYLEQTGSTEEPNVVNSPLGTPTYALKRAQFVMVPDSTNLNKPALAANQITSAEFASVSTIACRPVGANVSFFSPIDAAMPTGLHAIDLATFTVPQAPVSAPPATVLEQQLTTSSTLVLPNVISFQVQIMPTVGNAFIDVPVANGFHLYDTTQFNAAGANTFGLKAIQITLRVWDFKTRQTRQTTIMQDL